MLLGCCVLGFSSEYTTLIFYILSLLLREKLSVNPVSFEMCSGVAPSVGPSGASGPLGLIRIATFNGKTADAFREAYVAVKV